MSATAAPRSWVRKSRVAGARRRSFTLTGSMAYLDFEWTKYYGQCYFGLTPIAGRPNAGNCNYDGFTNQLAPKFTGVRQRAITGGSLGSRLRMGITRRRGLFLRVPAVADPGPGHHAGCLRQAQCAPVAGRRQRTLGAGAGGPQPHRRDRGELRRRHAAVATGCSARAATTASSTSPWALRWKCASSSRVAGAGP